MANAKNMTAITYNGSTIATLNGGQSATLKCAGMKMESDVVVDVAEIPESSDTRIIEVNELPTENIDRNVLYKVGDTYHQYGGELLDVLVVWYDGLQVGSFVDAIKANGATVELFYAKTKPTENIKETDDSIYNVYYVEDEDNIFVCTNGMWLTVSTALEGMGSYIPYFKTVRSIDDIGETDKYTGVLCALIYTGWKDYPWTNGTLTIEELGTHNVTDKKEVDVNLSAVVGVWKFEQDGVYENDDISSWTKFQFVNFTTTINGEVVNCIGIERYDDKKAGGCTMRYKLSDGSYYTAWALLGSPEWADEGCKTIDFGTEPQFVSGEFKQEFVAKATRIEMPESFKPSHLTIHTDLMAYFKDKIEKPTFAQKLNFVDGRIFFDSDNSEQIIGCPVHSEYVETDIGDGTMFEAVNISFRDVLGQRRDFWYVWEDDVPYAPAVISQLGVDGSVVTKEGWYELIVDGYVFHPVENASDIRNVSFGAVQPHGNYYYSLFDYKMSEDAENATPYLISTRIGEQNGIYLETKDKKCDTDIALLFSEKTFTVSQYRDLDVEHYYDAEFSTTEEFVDAVYVDIDYDGVEGLALQGDYYSLRPETGKTHAYGMGMMREPGTHRNVFSGGGTSMGIKLYFVEGSGRFSSIHTNATILSMSKEEVIITGLRHNTYILVKAVGDDVGGDSGDDDTGGDTGGGDTGGGDSGNTPDYTVSVGDYFGIAYDGASPAVDCPPCLEYQDDGGELVFTGVSVGRGTIKLIRSSEVFAEYTVEVTA